MKPSLQYTHPLYDRAYRVRVLAGQVTKQELRDNVRVARDSLDEPSLPDLKNVNSFFLWHLAHCPAAEVRAELLAQADEFAVCNEGYVDDLIKLLGFGDFDYLATLPIPYLPHLMAVSPTEHSWLQKITPGIQIYWLGTMMMLKKHGLLSNFLQNMQSEGCFLREAEQYLNVPRLFVADGQALVARNSMFRSHPLGAFYKYFPTQETVLGAISYVPSYSHWLIPPSFQITADLAFDFMRFALTLRARGVTIAQTGEELLSATQVEQFDHLQESAGEEAYLFYFSHHRKTLALLLKNGWPIGYGSVWPIQYQGTLAPENCAGIGIHIFEEYRKTDTSGRMFERLLEQAQQCYRPEAILLHRRLEWEEITRMQTQPEYKDPFTVFLEKRGFRFLPRDEYQLQPIMMLKAE